MSMLKALSPITVEKFIGDLFGPLQRVRDKTPMISKETWQTISYEISIESTVKFTKSGFSVKAPVLFKFELLLTWKIKTTTSFTDLVF